jgi:hypothetical protein
VKYSVYHTVIKHSFRQHALLEETEYSSRSSQVIADNMFSKVHVQSPNKKAQPIQKFSLFPIFILNICCPKEEYDTSPDTDGYIIEISVRLTLISIAES